MEASAQVARQAAAIRDVKELVNATVHLISEEFGFYHAGLFLLDETKTYAVLKAASSEGGQRMLARSHQLKVGEEGIVGYVAATGRSRIALDVGEDAVFFNNPDLPLTRSEIALPLKIRGEVIGVLDVQSTEAGAFSENDAAILQTMADQVALAIENARLVEQTQANVHELNILLGQYSREEWRRLTRERPTWGYAYDGIEVLPVSAAPACPLIFGVGATAPITTRASAHVPPSARIMTATDATEMDAASLSPYFSNRAPVPGASPGLSLIHI